MDEGRPRGSPLSRVKTFDSLESPAAVRRQLVQLMPDHAPKNVPATPLSMKATQPSRYATPYDPSGGPSPPPALFQGSKGPVYYTPPSRYPTPDDLAEERQRFMQQPDTPACDRSRRLSALREIALTLKPDPMAVPIGFAAG
jgi:hypothetical protein